MEGDELLIGSRRVRCLRQSDPAQLPWAELGVDTVIEVTGQFKTRDKAADHLRSGAGRVLIGAPAENADVMIVLGVNEDQYNARAHRVVSRVLYDQLADAVLRVLRDEFGLGEVAVTTVHAYTASQRVADTPASKMHRGRAAGVSMIPTSTGADQAALRIWPDLDISAMAVRVPVPDGSLADITAVVGRRVSAQEVNARLRATGKKPTSPSTPYRWRTAPVLRILPRWLRGSAFRDRVCGSCGVRE